ncbi:MAG: GTPase [Nanoarchaeota archaeon]|nr:GTPase [Nanoarchaeota archaeon]
MINRRFKANRPVQEKNTNITPYWQVIEKIINESNIILEVLDARMPKISRNKELELMIKEKNKELIFILNKSDLVAEKELRKTLRNLQKEAQTFVVSSSKKIGTKRLRDFLLRKGKKVEWFKIGVVGYPNTGKSSVINTLILRKKAIVTSKAGTTRGVQWINLRDNIQIIDSPGIIPIKQEDEIRYALIGSRNVERLINVELVAHAIIKLFENKNNLLEFYKTSCKSKDPEKIIEEIGKAKRFIKKKGEIDEIRTSTQIIRDWQRGKLRL